MFQGFYDLTSEMLTQNRNMNVISNNMSNIATAGFKSDRMTTTTFRDVMISRIENRDEDTATPIGMMSLMPTAHETITDYAQGAIRPSDSPLDFALDGNGFFCIQTDNGTVYTRDGSFTLDDEGYLFLPTVGRVLGENGPIQLTSDNISADSAGNIIDADGNVAGKLSIVDFQDYATQLKKEDNGTYTTQENAVAADAVVYWKATEGANVDAVEQMTAMMSGQRALQSSAQVLKMYDQLMGKIVNQLGPV